MTHTQSQSFTNTPAQCDQPTGAHAKQSDTTYRPPVDIFEFDDHYEILADLPGSDADAIELTVQDGQLEIFAQVPERTNEQMTPIHREYGIGNFKRAIRLGEDIETDALQATYENGMLTVSLPKRATQKTHRVQVRAG